MNKFSFCLVVLFIVLSGCSGKRSIPVPAISFQESIEDLKAKEVNELYDENISVGVPGTMQYILQMKNFKYVTSHKDTLTYFFMKDHLVSTFITLYDADRVSVMENLKSDEAITQVNECMFKRADDFIHVGTEHGKNVSLLYLNNEDGEIEDLLKLSKEINLGLDTIGSNEQFDVNVKLGLYAMNISLGTGDPIPPYKFYQEIFLDK